MILDHHPAELPEGATTDSPPKVLFLWYDDSIPNGVRRWLRGEFEVVAVHTRGDALEALASTKFCALIFNVISLIPDVDDQFPAELERLGYHLPVVVLTAAATQRQVGNIRWHPRSVFPDGNVLALIPQEPNLSCLDAIQTVLRAALADQSRQVRATVSSTSASP